MEDQFEKQKKWWKAKFKELQDALLGRSKLAYEPANGAPESHKEHSYRLESEPYKDYGCMLEPAVGALESHEEHRYRLESEPHKDYDCMFEPVVGAPKLEAKPIFS